MTWDKAWTQTNNKGLVAHFAIFSLNHDTFKIFKTQKNPKINPQKEKSLVLIPIFDHIVCSSWIRVMHIVGT